MKPLFYLGLAILAMGSPIRSEDAPGGAALPAKKLTGEGLIALTLRDAEGRLQIFTIHPDGTGRKQLTSEGQSGIPTWSHDGRRIAFMSIRTTTPGWR